jgi:CheY-like chemotaxis protein
LRPLALRANAKELELACRIAPDVPENLEGDAGRLRQVLCNLVGNAVKFTENGEILVQVEVERASADEVELHFEVSDTGVGIPRAKQEAIFAPFTQADGSTTRKYGGTGLGLSISARLVELMGGRCWLVSEVGKGSTFHFTSRFRPASGTQVRDFGKIPAELKGVAVLVVDDNATNRRIFEEVLRKWHAVPVLADSVKAARTLLEGAAAKGSPFRLALVDLHMPEADGFSLVEWINANSRLQRPAVVMLTSGAHPGDLARCRHLKVASYLMKPVTPTELLLAAANALHLSLRRSGGSRPESNLRRIEGIAGMTILLAEDNEVNREVAVRLLEKRGCRVTVCTNGQEAVEKSSNEAFDLILMDVQMPVMDGLEATANIRRRELTNRSRVPIIALTAYAMKGDAERCLAAGMDGYVSKPLRPDELVQALYKVAPVRPAPSASRI